MYPVSVLYVKSFTAVGRKLISLLICSILKVYKGVLIVCGLAATHVMASTARAVPMVAYNLRFLFMFSPPYRFTVVVQEMVINLFDI